MDGEGDRSDLWRTKDQSAGCQGDMLAAGRRPENRFGAIRVNALGALAGNTYRVWNGIEKHNGEMAEWSKALPC